jgi:hypothetical protein
MQVVCGRDFCVAVTAQGAFSTPLHGDDAYDPCSDMVALPEDSLEKQKLRPFHASWTFYAPEDVSESAPAFVIPGHRSVFSAVVAPVPPSTIIEEEVGEVMPTFMLPAAPPLGRPTVCAPGSVVGTDGLSPTSLDEVTASPDALKLVAEPIATEVPQPVVDGQLTIIPPGWARYLDEESDPYYYCEASGDTTWLLFWEFADTEGTPYFVNCETQETQWDRPADAVIVVAE